MSGMISKFPVSLDNTFNQTEFLTLHVHTQLSAADLSLPGPLCWTKLCSWKKFKSPYVHGTNTMEGRHIVIEELIEMSWLSKQRRICQHRGDGHIIFILRIILAIIVISCCWDSWKLENGILCVKQTFVYI